MRQRSKFSPHWSIQILLGLLILSFLVFGFFEGILPDPALSNVISKISFLVSFIIYLLWFIIRSSIKIIYRLAFLLILVISGIYFKTQYQLRGFSGSLNPEFEKVGSREPNALNPLKGFIYSQNAKLEGASFTQFMSNPQRDGWVKGRELSEDWSKTPLVEVWRRKIGEGLSGFAIQGDYAVTMEQRGPYELTVCYDTTTGKPRWAHRVETRHDTNLGGVGPRATPLIENGKVYSVGSYGDLCCLDINKGEVVWQKSILKLINSNKQEDLSRIAWGRSGSPLLVDDLLIVPGGGKGQDFSSLLAFHANTGKLVWKGGQQQISYASPQLLTIEGVVQIVSINESSVSGHDTKTGKELWQTELPGRTNANANCSEVCLIDSNKLLLTKGYNTGTKLIELNRSGTKWSLQTKWKSRKLLRTKFSSPIRGHENVVIGLNETKLQAIDALKGEELWKGGRYGYGQLIRYNDQLLVLAEDGKLVLVDLKTGSELGSLQILTGKTWCTLAVAGDLLFARNNQEAVCYRLPLKK